MPAETKITFAELREMGVPGLLICCSDYRCSRSIAISGNRWPDQVRLSDIEPRFTCQACGRRGADVRPDFDWNRKPVATMAVGSRQKFRLLDYLHCPAFLRLSIVCRHPEVQAFPAANCGPRFWHALVQALTSQLTAAARADGADDSG